MSEEKPISIATAFPTADLPATVGFLTLLLGTEPTFVDGERWAQFDFGPTRVAVAGADRSAAGVGDSAALLVKTADVEAAAKRLAAAGCTVSEPQTGAHEVRVRVAGPGGIDVVLYQPS